MARRQVPWRVLDAQTYHLFVVLLEFYLEPADHEIRMVFTKVNARTLAPIGRTFLKHSERFLCEQLDVLLCSSDCMS